MIYIILNVIWCFILTSNISVNYMYIFVKLNKIIIIIRIRMCNQMKTSEIRE